MINDYRVMFEHNSRNSTLWACEAAHMTYKLIKRQADLYSIKKEREALESISSM